MKNQLSFLALSAALLAAGCTEKPTDPNTKSGPFPILVSTNWIPSGYMGSGIAMSTSACATRSSATAKGDCYQITYTPAGGWGGVFWQSPANNWGTYAGKAVPAGAKKVTFFAKSDLDGQVVSFQAGGINTDGMAGAYKDSFMAKTDVSLTTAWKSYSIDMSTQTYTEVFGGFEYTISSSAPVVFYLDDIKWSN